MMVQIYARFLIFSMILLAFANKVDAGNLPNMGLRIYNHTEQHLIVRPWISYCGKTHMDAKIEKHQAMNCAVQGGLPGAAKLELISGYGKSVTCNFTIESNDHNVVVKYKDCNPQLCVTPKNQAETHVNIHVYVFGDPRCK